MGNGPLTHAADKPEAILPTAGVSLRAAEGWAGFRRKHDLTYTALVEAIGLWMAENIDTPEGDLGPAPRWVVDTAHAVQAERRRRK